MRRRARASRALALAASALVTGAVAVTAPPAVAQEAPTSPPSLAEAADVEALIEALQGSDGAARSEVLARLGEVVARRPDALEPFLALPDPDVRFQVLFLLGVRDARTEQRVRQIVEGRPSFAPTYPEALEARAALLDDAQEEARELGAPRRTLEHLVGLARRRAGSGDLATRYAIVALGLAAEMLARCGVVGDDARDAAAALATLLEVDLGDATYELCACFMALPPEAAHGALQSVIERGSPLARARAARVLGEIAGPTRADQAAAAVRPLLGHAAPEVRLAALVALSVMPLGDAALADAAALANDADAGVAVEALRLAGERRLASVREAAERVARDPDAALQVRRQAVRTLGLLGDPAAATALSAVLRSAGDRDLQVLAAWSLGAVRAPGALEALLGLLQHPGLADDARLFAGLARLGPVGVEALRAMLEAPSAPAEVRHGRRLAAIVGLGRTTPDRDGRGPREAVAVLVGLAERPIAENLGDAGRVTGNELDHVVQALAELAPRCDDARAAIARLVVERGHQQRLLGALVAAVAEVGPPLDPSLAAALSAQLSRLLQQPTTGSLRAAVAAALVRVDADQARAALTRLVGTPGRGGLGEDLLGLMRLLARAGDREPVRQVCVPLARARLGASRDDRAQDERLTNQNQLGIELLYAGEWDEAILEFERMLWARHTGDSAQTAAYNVACGHALSGRIDRALLALRRSVRLGFDKTRHMAADADLDSLRADVRFQRLMERLRLEEETELRATNDGWPRRFVPD